MDFPVEIALNKMDKPAGISRNSLKSEYQFIFTAILYPCAHKAHKSASIAAAMFAFV